jgi:hypothetical protein
MGANEASGTSYEHLHVCAALRVRTDSEDNLNRNAKAIAPPKHNCDAQVVVVPQLYQGPMARVVPDPVTCPAERRC